tara:strand:+ start:31 stop:786 length:756 start_codon:yes stop_codon:yes gene_type:complete
MSTKIIVRFDDICPNLNWEIFLMIKSKLQDFGIRSVLGVIPDNKDKSFLKYEYKEKFFDLINDYKDFGDTIAQHGTHHKYSTNSSGILKINNRSEYAGHDFKYQYKLIKKGKQILESNSCWQPVFMAPSHSFDENTLLALNKLGFKSISDGYGFFPYQQKGIYFVPQISSRPFNTGFGLATICIHTNNLNKKNVKSLLEFISSNRSRIINYEEYIKIKSPPKYIDLGLNFLSRKVIRSLRILKKYGTKNYK